MVYIPHPHINCSVQSDKNSLVCTAQVTIEQPLISTVYNYLLKSQKDEARTAGFSQGAVPLTYVEQMYRDTIINQVKEFFLHHCVRGFLEMSLINQHKIAVSVPSLVQEIIDPHNTARFTFEFLNIEPEVHADWKKLSFKAPQRKNYKDLDRQVELFLKEEEKLSESIEKTIQVGDWVLFNLSILGKDNAQIIENYSDTLWIRIGDEEADGAVQDLFIGREINDTFITTSSFLQDYLNAVHDGWYIFKVTILDRVPAIHFSLDQFKKHFRLKTTKDVHHKLIEVFSYRNDLSQRRETVEAVFKLLLNHHTVSLPASLVEYAQAQVLERVHYNPDYYVYKAQRDFKQKIQALAIKQLKEMIIIDYLSYKEEIQVTADDMLGYLNLLKRPRTKEFIYFGLPPTKVNGQEIAIPTDVLYKACQREKMLNLLIYYLTKR